MANGVFSTPMGPVLVLWVGALVLHVLDRFLTPQDRGVAEALVLALGLGFLIGTRSQIDAPLSFGQFLTGAGRSDVPPFLVAGQTSWTLALLAVVTSFASSLASLGQSTDGRAGRLAALGSALLFVFAGDWATLTVAWVLVDVCLLHTLGDTRKRTDALGWTGILSLGGAVALGIGLLLWHQADGSIWVDRGGAVPHLATAATHLPSHASSVLILAALLRLMPFPLPTWLTDFGREAQAKDQRFAQVLTYLVPTLLGGYLWMRLAGWNVIGQAARWLIVLPIWGGWAMIISALKAWAARDPAELVACTGTFGGACVLMAASLNLPAPWQTLISANAILSVSVLFVSWTQCQHLRMFDPRSFWRIAPAGLGLLSLAGLPLTIGFPARVALYHAVFADQRWFSLTLVVAAELLLFGALLRVLLELELVPEEETEEAAPSSSPVALWELKERVYDGLGYGAGAILALGIVVLGLAPRLPDQSSSLPSLGNWLGLPTLPVWAALLLAVVGALVVYRSRNMVLNLTQGWGGLIERLFGFGWLYRSIETLSRYVGALIWGSTQVVEGAGYMAWVALVCLVILLFVIAR